MRETVAEAQKCKICRVVIKTAEKNKAAIMDKSWEIREAFSEEVTFGWRPEGGEGGHKLSLGQRIREESRVPSLEVGVKMAEGDRKSVV